MRRLGLLLAVGATWLFLAALPALADGGPHVADVNNGSTSLTADSCAGCHRVHTAQAPMLLKEDEEAMCLSCHGAGTGATTDVLTGIQYVPAANGTRTGTELGALRGGGFETTAIGDPFKYKIGGANAGTWTKVQVDYDATAGTLGANPVTSAHMDLTGGLGQQGILWGNGANGTGAGPEVSISCGSCHNPHGNNQYRILHKSSGPSATDTNTATTPNFSNAWVVQVFDYGVVAPSVYRSVSSMGVQNGDSITVAGNSLAGANRSGTITMVDAPTCPAAPIPPGTVCDDDSTPNDTLFTLSGTSPATSGTGGTATRTGGVGVTDSAVTPAAGDAKNYTVIQANLTFNLVGVSGGVYTTTAAHNFAVGQFVTVASITCTPACATPTDAGVNNPNTTAKVATTPSATTFTLSGVTFAGDGTGGKAIGVNQVLLASQAAPYSNGAGDYFHYRVPWNNSPSTLDNPNGVPGGSTAQSIFQGGFGEQMASWCAQCHTRYWAWSEPTDTPDDPDGTSGPAYENARPGDSIFMYQHRTRGASGRGCLTCHVSHGTSAVMSGPYSGDYVWPNQVPADINVTGAGNDNSRLLKVDNRGTCQQCHDPTGTFSSKPNGTQFPPAPYPIPGTP